MSDQQKYCGCLVRIYCWQIDIKSMILLNKQKIQIGSYFNFSVLQQAAEQIKMNWCKGKCYSSDVGEGYLVKKSNKDSKFYNKIADIQKPLLEDKNVSIVKLQKSNFEELNKKSRKQNKKFTDSTFVPSHNLIGKLDQNMGTDLWKRLSDLKQKFSIFNKQTSPFQATSYTTGTKVLHAALAAIAEDQERLNKIFDQQQFNQNGLYKILLKNKSKVEEIIIDDYMPFVSQGKHALSKPLNNQIWVLLLEKAMAKVYGTYQKMYRQLSTPNDVFECLLYSVSQNIQRNSMNSQPQQIWKKLTANKSPICFYTSKEGDAGKNLHLTPNHYYTILGAEEFKDINGVSERIVKLRDAFNNDQLRGDLTFGDNKFWQSIDHEDAKKLLTTRNDKNGIFFMRFSKFLEVYQTIYLSNYESTYSYISEQLKSTIKNGHLYQIQSFKPIPYHFIIEQYDLTPLDKSQFYHQDGYCRTTILLIEIDYKEKDNKYKLIQGIMKYNQKKVVLSPTLLPGKYLLYVKIEATINKKNYPKTMNFAVYSQFLLKIQSKKQQNHPDLLKKIFLKDAKENKKQFYEQGKMWASWNVINGGYAYIVLVNKKDSQSKFVVKLDQQLINSKNFKLKKPFKGKRFPEFEILPDSEEIILLRVKNSNVKQISFPIPIDLSIEPLKQTK